MSITVYDDVILPNGVLSAGVGGKQIRSNRRSVALNGNMQINVAWDRTLREYTLGLVPLSIAQWRTIEGLHEVTEGGAFGFLMQDPKDSAVTASEGILYPFDQVLVGTPGFGYGVAQYKLYKRYTAIGSGRYKDRSITRPKTAAVLLNGSPITIGTSPGNASINYATGTITFVPIPPVVGTVSSVTRGASTIYAMTAPMSGVIIGNTLTVGGTCANIQYDTMTQAMPQDGQTFNVTAVSGSDYTVAVDSSTADVLLSVTLGATTTLTFAQPVVGLSVGDDILVGGFVGANASVLNSYFPSGVTAVSGSTVSVGVNTTGLAISMPPAQTLTKAADTSVYPQPSDTLTWSGDFYVPVHFENDTIDWSLVASGEYGSRFVAGPQCVLSEVRE